MLFLREHLVLALLMLYILRSLFENNLKKATLTSPFEFQRVPVVQHEDDGELVLHTQSTRQEGSKSSLVTCMYSQNAVTPGLNILTANANLQREQY